MRRIQLNNWICFALVLFVGGLLFVVYKNGYPQQSATQIFPDHKLSSSNSRDQTPSNELHRSSSLAKPTEELDKMLRIVDALPTFPTKSLTLPVGFKWTEADDQLENIVLSISTNESLLETLALKYIKRLQIECSKQTRIGRVEDGGWDACIAPPFDIVKPCLVYSIGMGGEWSFDEMITTKYGCNDMAYDPTLGKPDHKPNPSFWFFNTGIGSTNHVNGNNWKIRTLSTLLRDNNHTETTIDILKMDIEYAEWESLETILSEPSCLNNVKQLMVEYHTREMLAWPKTTLQDLSLFQKTSSVAELVQYWNIARGLDKLGFKAWNVWSNEACKAPSKRNIGQTISYCFNVYYVNAKYFK